MPDHGIFIAVSPVRAFIASPGYQSGIIIFIHVHIADIFFIVIVVYVILAVITSHIYQYLSFVHDAPAPPDLSRRDLNGYATEKSYLIISPKCHIIGI